MRSESWPDDLQSSRQRGRPHAPRARCRRPRPAGRPLSLEPLEDRNLPSAVPPVPIPAEAIAPGIHAFLPGPADAPLSMLPFGREPSTITDFTGFVGVVHLQGTETPTGGTGTDAVSRLYDVDLRFMQGVYRGVDNRFHFGTFALV
jgi:hypothetical protein